MKHIIRAAGLLVAILIVAFVVPKLVPKPLAEGLAPYGFYAQKDNAAEWKAFPVQYADPVRCNTCHQNNYTSWISAEHKSVSCENCHGAAETHIEQGVPLEIDRSRDLCLTCHAEAVGRPSTFPQKDPEKHNPGLDCSTCHNPHDPGF